MKAKMKAALRNPTKHLETTPNSNSVLIQQQPKVEMQATRRSITEVRPMRRQKVLPPRLKVAIPDPLTARS